jgi:antitoxin component YwqK of YwqJK toxin-antitoxin module
MQEHIEYHKNGSVLAKGQTKDGQPEGYWEWFRHDGSIMRSGYFSAGEQTGQWITYNKQGNVHKVTTINDK